MSAQKNCRHPPHDVLMPNEIYNHQLCMIMANRVHIQPAIYNKQPRSGARGANMEVDLVEWRWCVHRGPQQAIWHVWQDLLPLWLCQRDMRHVVLTVCHGLHNSESRSITCSLHKKKMECRSPQHFHTAWRLTCIL